MKTPFRRPESWPWLHDDMTDLDNSAADRLILMAMAIGAVFGSAVSLAVCAVAVAGD